MSQLNLRELKGAISLISKFDIDDDAEKIDSIICYAIEKGLDIEYYDSIELEEITC
jgi:hypothetical protein